MMVSCSSKIRVGIIGPCPPPYGGVTRLIANNLQNWKTKDVEAFFIPYRIPNDPEPAEGAVFIDYRNVSEKLPISLTLMIRYLATFPLTRVKNYLEFYKYNCALAKLIQDLKIDILYAHHSNVTGLSGVLQSHIHGIPSVIVSYGETWLVSRLDRRFKRMAKYTLREADWVIATSEHCRKGALQLGADPNRSSVVYAGIDLEKFRPSLDGKSYRKKLRIAPESIVISILGLVLRQKIDTLLDAIQLLREYKNITFLIGGVGADFDYLRDKVKELDMNNVKLMGFIPEEDLPLFYVATDILVASPKTLTECMGQSIKEAMACARPTVVANIGGGPEAISHMNNGLLFEPGRPEALKTALEKLIDDPLLRKRVGENAVSTAENKFDAIKSSKDTLRIFEQLLRESSQKQ